MFTARILGRDDAPIAWPLAACRYPGLSLPRWTDFVCRADLRGPCETLVGLTDTRGRIHALFGYEIVAASDGARHLHITHIATFRLAGNAIYSSFDAAIERIAVQNGCVEIVVEGWRSIGEQDGPLQAPEDVAPGRRILSIAPATERPAELN